jgi:O-antigen/teichoic acid export membrane protein
MLWVIFAWVVPVTRLTAFNVSLAFMVLQGIKAIAYGRIGKKGGIFQGRLDFQRVRSYSQQIISDSMPFYWLSLMTAVTTQLPIIFLAERSGKAEVALYNIGFRLINPLQMIIMTSLTALYPVLSRYGGGRNNTRFMESNQKAISGIVIMGTLGALIISLLRNEVVFFLFGSAYKSTADALAYQCWYVVLYSILCMIGTSLGANDKQDLLAKLSTAYSLISLPILWFGSGYGATGLAVAILIGCVVNMSYHYYYFQKSLPSPMRYQDTFQSLGILVVGAVFAWFVPTIWPLMARITLSLLFCAGFVYYFILSTGKFLLKH